MCSLCDDEYDTEKDFFDDTRDYDERDLGGRSQYIDVDRLRDEVSFVTIHPEKWNQREWAAANEEAKFAPTPPTACGTVGCLAGNAVVHSDGELQWEKGKWWDPTIQNYRPYWKTEYVIMPGDEDKRHIQSAATNLLGLTSEQADYLFAAENDLDDLWSLSYIISDGKITPEDRAKAEAERARVEAQEKEAYVGQ